MFKLVNSEALYKTDVTIRQPLPDGGTAECDVVLQLKYLPQEEWVKAAVEGDATVVCKIVHGWDGIHDADDKPLPFTRENVAALAQLSFFSHAVITAYQDRFIPSKN